MSDDPKMVEVQWLDAAMLGGWHDTDTTLVDVLVSTVGYLVRDEEGQIQLAQSRTAKEYGNLVMIPRGMIRLVTNLEIPG